MKLAQKLHSEAELEQGRIEFYERFAEMEAETRLTVVEPLSAITCENYYTLQQRGKVKIDCRACRDKKTCLLET